MRENEVLKPSILVGRQFFNDNIYESQAKLIQFIIVCLLMSLSGITHSFFVLFKYVLYVC